MENTIKVESIESENIVAASPNEFITRYIINKDNDTRMYIVVKKSKYYPKEKSNEIVANDANFINGFKVVKTINGEFAYIREEDNKLLPFRYDVAMNFNEYGYAMVGKNGTVSWIDKTFRYLNIHGRMADEKENTIWGSFEGWNKIDNFSESNNPLSRIIYTDNKYIRVAYLNTDSKLQSFCQYNGKFTDNDKQVFEYGEVFNEKGQAWADDCILFDQGFYITKADLLRLCDKNGYINLIGLDAMREKNEKVLKKEIR